MEQPVRRRNQRNPADYGYPIPDVAALSAKALEVTERLTILYGVAEWSRKDPMSMLVDIILSHRTRDEQTAAAYENLLQRFGSWEEYDGTKKLVYPHFPCHESHLEKLASEQSAWRADSATTLFVNEEFSTKSADEPVSWYYYSKGNMYVRDSFILHYSHACAVFYCFGDDSLGVT